MSDIPSTPTPPPTSTDTVDLTTPQRQSPIAVLAELFNVQLLVNLAQGLLPLLLIGVATSPTLLIALLPLVLLAVGAILIVKWRRTMFWVENDELVLEKGLLNRSRLQIPLDRIQQIATEQGIVQQIFNVRKIRVDTAGSASAEFTLSAVDDAVVLQLRKAVVGADKAGTAPPPPVDGIAVPHEPRPGLATESRVLDRQDRRTMLLRHEIRDLVELAVARPNGQLLAAIVAVSTLGLGGVVRSLLADSDIGSIAAMLLGAVGLAILIVVLIASTVLREFELTVWRSDEGLRLTAGLFKKREQFARTERVQLVRYRNNLVERWFNRTSVYFPQASATGGGIEGAATRQLFGVPGAPDSRLDELTSQFLPTERPPLNEAISKNAITRWTLWGGLVPALMLLLIATISALIEGLTLLPIVIGVVAISFVIVARLIARRVHRGWRWGIDCGVINSQNGVINISRVAVAIRKVQSVRLHQGWWHRRNGLATIEFGTAGGSLRLPYLPIEVAQGLRDDVLLAVESDTGAWM